MSEQPYLALAWTGATEADIEKALAGVNAAFAAIGSTAAEGAIAQGAREAADDDEIEIEPFTDGQDNAADLWLSVESLVVTVLGKNPDQDRLPGFDYWIEPWASQMLAEIEAAKDAAAGIETSHSGF